MKIASTAESTSMCAQLSSAAVYWLNEFNLLQFLLLVPVFFIPITFGKKVLSMPPLLPFESNQYVFNCVTKCARLYVFLPLMFFATCFTFYCRFKSQKKTFQSRYDSNLKSILLCWYILTSLVRMGYKASVVVSWQFWKDKRMIRS